MKYHSTRNKEQKYSFREAALIGLAPDRGLFVPDTIPQLPAGFFEELPEMDSINMAMRVMRPYVGEDIPEERLHQILKETLAFSLPLRKLDEESYVMELFHGPTMAFKDVGARFMARCMAEFRKGQEEITVLVATSGDTGSAVAHGFYEVPGVKVEILYPKGKISPFQEQQMTSLGGNISAWAVDGSFDDCQRLVKQALNDADLTESLQLSSANSINVARFLPQMIYYFMAYAQLRKRGDCREVVMAVPCGNLGNLTAGLYAHRMGLPIHKFVAAQNANDAFYRYLKEGEYLPKSTIATYSNAMDVGAPSNFSRILELFDHNLEAIRKLIVASSTSDEQTLGQIRQGYDESHYISDPHAAVALHGLQGILGKGQAGIFLATAHPRKFEDVVSRAVPGFNHHKSTSSPGQRKCMSNSYAQLKDVLLV